MSAGAVGLRCTALALLITIFLSAVISQITLPPVVVNGQEVPQRVVRLLMEEKPTPPPAPVEMPKPKVRVEKKPVEQPVKLAKVEPKVEEDRKSTRLNPSHV